MTRAASARPRSRRRAPSAAPQAEPLLKAYLQRSERPLTSLLFLLAPILIYEIGVRYFFSTEIIASRLLEDFFNLFGATGRALPALAVVGILLSWHVARGDPWKIYPGTMLAMLGECALLVAPVTVLYTFTAQYVPLYAAASTPQGLIVMSLGAGIYEELVFRLIALTSLDLFLLDFLDLPKMLGIPLVVILPAVLFAMYHYLGYETFHWQSFAFRTLAGVYFGAIFLLRGFGITAGTHAAYDIFVVLLAYRPLH